MRYIKITFLTATHHQPGYNYYHGQGYPGQESIMHCSCPNDEFSMIKYICKVEINSFKQDLYLQGGKSFTLS